MIPLVAGEVFGLVRPYVDAHTLGISYMAKLIQECGYRVVIGDRAVTEAVNLVARPQSVAVIRDWLKLNRITRLGLSYRLDPGQATELFGRLHYQLSDQQLLASRGGSLRGLYFAGLPSACAAIDREYQGAVPVFQGDESPTESLAKLGVPPERIPASIRQDSWYDEDRMRFGRELVARADHLRLGPVNRSGYAGYATDRDLLVNRVGHGMRHRLPPLMRVHGGPYQPDRINAVNQFIDWLGQLRAGGLLDIISIGTSQLTQERFGEAWGDASNGGGVPVNSEDEYRRIAEAARPMLVRTYAGTTRIPELARLHERSLNIAWHALSFWWFSRIDGRGPHGVLENLREHVQALDFIAGSGKPFEPNIPHHFAFRGADDVSYVVSAVLAARTAKKRGIRHLVLQNMLNTPKHTWGVQDLAKSRAMLRLVRELEDATFRVILQPRAGLDYFSPDLDKAKAQLASVSALMDDIEPDDSNSPPVVHVVSYSEASHLADPPVIHESIQITRHSIAEYRRMRARGEVEYMGAHPDVTQRMEELLEGARDVLRIIERTVPEPYSPEGLYKILAAGFLPVPYLWGGQEEFQHALEWRTDTVSGGIVVVDEAGRVIPPRQRAEAAAMWVPHIRLPVPTTPVISP